MPIPPCQHFTTVPSLPVCKTPLVSHERVLLPELPKAPPIFRLQPKMQPFRNMDEVYDWSRRGSFLGESLRKPTNFSSLDECGRTLERLAKSRASNSEDSESRMNEVIPCINYLYGRLVNIRDKEQNSDSTVLASQRASVVSLLIDALLIYHLERGWNSLKRTLGIDGLEEKNKELATVSYESLLACVYFLNSRETAGLVKIIPSRLYLSLLLLHGDSAQLGSCFDIREACLLHYLYGISQLGSACLLDVIETLDAMAEDFFEERGDFYEGWLESGLEASVRETEDALAAVESYAEEPVRPPWWEQSHQNAQKWAWKLHKACLRLDLSPSQLLLDAPGLGRNGRGLLLELCWLGDYSLESRDIGCFLACTACELHGARSSIVAAEKVVHCHRAMGHLAEVRRHWSTDKHLRFGSLNQLVTESLDAIQSALVSLPVSPLAIEVAERKELFYFAFFIDHENFFHALHDWICIQRPDLAKYCTVRNPLAPKGIPREVPMFGYVKEEKKGREIERPAFQARKELYRGEHYGLMRYVIQRLSSGWRNAVGIEQFDFVRSYAFWGRNFPNIHDETYTEFGIKPERPRGIPQAHSQAVDHEIFSDISSIARGQMKKPYFLIVSGDSGYAEVLRGLYERHGTEYHYWFFKTQPVKVHLPALVEERCTMLEEILRLDELTLEHLKEGIAIMEERERSRPPANKRGA